MLLLLGRKTEMTDPDLGHWQYRYDPAGNMLVHADSTMEGKNQLDLKDVNGKPITLAHNHTPSRTAVDSAASCIETPESALPTYLPAQTTSFVGHERGLPAFVRLLPSPQIRLVT